MGLRVRTENSEAGLSYMARLHRKREGGRKGGRKKGKKERTKERKEGEWEGRE